MVGIEVSHHTRKVFCFLTVYNPPFSFPSVKRLEKWLTAHYSRQQTTIISMDTNLHHRHWNPPGCRKVELEARKLLICLSCFGFRLSSPKHVPTFYSAKGKGTTIDLIWSNFLGSKLIKTATVSSENFGSDHQALRVQLVMGQPTPAYHWKPPKWSEVDGKKLEALSAELLSLSSSEPADPNTQAEKLTNFLRQAQGAVPQGKGEAMVVQ
jgi:hypothetical protein